MKPYLYSSLLNNSKYWIHVISTHISVPSAALTRIGSVKDKPKSGTFNPTRFPATNGDMDQNGDLINSSVQGLKKVSLYVLGEKTQMKVISNRTYSYGDNYRIHCVNFLRFTFVVLS